MSEAPDLMVEPSSELSSDSAPEFDESLSSFVFWPDSLPSPVPSLCVRKEKFGVSFGLAAFYCVHLRLAGERTMWR